MNTRILLTEEPSKKNILTAVEHAFDKMDTRWVKNYIGYVFETNYRLLLLFRNSKVTEYPYTYKLICAEIDRDTSSALTLVNSENQIIQNHYIINVTEARKLTSDEEEEFLSMNSNFYLYEGTDETMPTPLSEGERKILWSLKRFLYNLKTDYERYVKLRARAKDREGNEQIIYVLSNVMSDADSAYVGTYGKGGIVSLHNQSCDEARFKALRENALPEAIKTRRYKLSEIARRTRFAQITSQPQINEMAMNQLINQFNRIDEDDEIITKTVKKRKKKLQPMKDTVEFISDDDLPTTTRKQEMAAQKKKEPKIKRVLFLEIETKEIDLSEDYDINE